MDSKALFRKRKAYFVEAGWPPDRSHDDLASSTFPLAAARELFQNGGGTCVSKAKHANLLVTALKSKSRIGRNIPREKLDITVVSAEWIRQSVESNKALPMNDFQIEIPSDLKPPPLQKKPDISNPPSPQVEVPPVMPTTATRTSPNAPVGEDNRLVVNSSDEESRFESHPDRRRSESPRKRLRVNSPSPPRVFKHVHGRGAYSDSSGDDVGSQNEEPLTETSEDEADDILLDAGFVNSKYCCTRPTPLHGPNDALVSELEIIEKSRHLNGEARSALSYRKGIAAIKAYPRKLRSSKEAKKIKGVGPKIANMVKQFNVLGHIPEARRIDADDRFHILAMFASVYGVGHVTARLWYAHGHRTLTDVMDSNSEKLNYLQEKGLEYHQDFSQKMSRADVEELIRYIRQGLDVLDPGITLEAVGGYSRGKTENGDLDVVISHPNAGREKTLLADVVKHFQNEGFILDVMYQGQSSPVEHIGPNKQSGGHGFDKLDKCFAAVRQPSTRTLRQVDFIISPYEVLSCALIGWQGSTLFERDLKRWCQSRGYKFYSHGLFRIKTGEKIEVRSPKQFFDILGLPYLDPTVRNC